MTFTNLAPPSRNPTVEKRLTSVLAFVMRKFLQRNIDDMLPAQVVSYNRATNMAAVQPLVSMVSTLNTTVQRAQIAQVPVLQLGGGGFVLNFPIAAGDLGWLKANDRDISLFKQIWKIVTPPTARFHSFEDAIFIPSILTGFTIQNPDSANAVLQSLGGTVRISLGNGNACITDESGYAQSTSAVLDTQSTTRAFKVPRMTIAQRNAIPAPEGGFIVYVTDAPSPHFSFYTDGTGWS